MQYKGLEVKVGIVIFLCMVMLIGLLIVIGGKGILKKGYEVRVRFAFIDGLEDNAPVRFAGVEVGKVIGIRAIPESELSKNDTARVEATLRIAQDLVLHKDCKIRLTTLGLMGGKYVAISPGSGEAAVIKPDEVLRGEDPLDMAELMDEGRKVLANLESITTDLSEIMTSNKDNIDETIANLWEVSKALSKDLETILGRLDKLLNNADIIITSNQEDLREAIKNLKDTTANAKEFSRKINEKPNAIIWGYKEKKELRKKDGKK